MNKENNDIINNFLLVGDKFIPELHLWDPKVKKYSALGPFTKHEQVFKYWSFVGNLQERIG